MPYTSIESNSTDNEELRIKQDEKNRSPILPKNAPKQTKKEHIRNEKKVGKEKKAFQ